MSERCEKSESVIGKEKVLCKTRLNDLIFDIVLFIMGLKDGNLKMKPLSLFLCRKAMTMRLRVSYSKK